LGPLAALPLLLGEFGIDAGEVLGEFRLAPSVFDDSENTLPYAVGGRLLSLCVERTRCPHFGLLVGQRAPAQSMGPLGYLMLSSPTVGTALEILAAHLNVHDRGSVVALRREGRIARLTYSVIEPDVERADQVHALSIAVARNILRALCSPVWKPQYVTFAFARPKEVAPYRECFGVTPSFDAAESALAFPDSQLALALPGADIHLHRMMKQRVASQSYAADQDIVDNVRRLLLASDVGAPLFLAEVATKIGVHSRKLERMLAEHGTSYRKLRDQVLHDIACKLLSETNMPLAEIASTLGYSETAAFTRAFSRWCGLTPLRWRFLRRGEQRS
jgi:AraC-like DNA-binding protein